MKELLHYIEQMNLPQNKILMLIKPVNDLYIEYIQLYGYDTPYLSREQYIKMMEITFSVTVVEQYGKQYFNKNI